MQYRIFSLAALAACAYAQDDSAAQSSDAAQLYILPPQAIRVITETLTQTFSRLSVVSVLQTALPSSLIQEALTNSAGVSSQLASEFAAGETPTWFTALPTDVQTYLVPAIANATAVTTGASSTGTGGLLTVLTNGTSTSNFTSSSSTLTSVSSTTRRTTVTESSQTGASATGNRGSSSSEAGAAMPTVVAMGIAGLAAGMVGVLAL